MSFIFNPTGPDFVDYNNIIKSCKPKHSKECDDINMYVLSKVTDQIVKPPVHTIFHSPLVYFLAK